MDLKQRPRIIREISHQACKNCEIRGICVSPKTHKP